MYKFFLSMLLLTVASCVPKQKSLTDYLKSNLKYSVTKSAMVFKGNKITPSVERIVVSIPKELKKEFFELSPSKKLELLDNPTTDWNTNLLLYEEYEKNPSLFLDLITNRKQWISHKSTDIEEWKILLN